MTVRKSEWSVERGGDGGVGEKFVGGRAGSCRFSCLVASILEYVGEVIYEEQGGRGQAEQAWKSC